MSRAKKTEENAWSYEAIGEEVVSEVEPPTHSLDNIGEAVLQEKNKYEESTQVKVRKLLNENEWIRNKLDEYANFVLGLLGNQDAQPFLDYANSNSIAGALGLGELMFGIIRRQLQDRDFSGAMDSGWDSGMKFTQREVLCEVCKLPIPNARLGTRAGCNWGGAILEGKTITRKLEEVCPLILKREENEKKKSE